jgi:hypothetical protein
LIIQLRVPRTDFGRGAASAIPELQRTAHLKLHPQTDLQHLLLQLLQSQGSQPFKLAK